MGAPLSVRVLLVRATRLPLEAGLNRMAARIQATVAGLERRAGDVCVIDLVAGGSTLLPPFEAGAHVEVLVRPDLIRPYSLCNDPAEAGRYRLGVLRDPSSRGGSEIICSQWYEGMSVVISEPRNLFALNEHTDGAVLVGAGIGITPLLSMAHRLETIGKPYELHYCIRDMARAHFLEDVSTGPFARRSRLHLSSSRRFDLTVDIGAPPSASTDLYICGPGAFMDDALAKALALGWPRERVHFEQFAAETDMAGGAFQVTLTSGETFDIAEGETIAQRLIAEGFDIEISCEQGICGSCIVDVVDGIPDHRDNYLTDDEKRSNNCMTLCCSRALTASLTLDLP